MEKIRVDHGELNHIINCNHVIYAGVTKEFNIAADGLYDEGYRGKLYYVHILDIFENLRSDVCTPGYVFVIVGRKLT